MVKHKRRKAFTLQHKTEIIASFRIWWALKVHMLSPVSAWLQFYFGQFILNAPVWRQALKA
jgi:hypothetical protein